MLFIDVEVVVLAVVDLFFFCFSSIFNHFQPEKKDSTSRSVDIVVI